MGETLAEVVLVHDDGRETRLPLRRRFEVHSPSYSWGRMAFASRPHRLDAPRALTDPLSQGTDWGELQTDRRGQRLRLRAASARSGSRPCANPRPERPLRALRLEARSEDVVALCGLTLFRGQENPLRFERLCLYRLTLPGAGRRAGTVACRDRSRHRRTHVLAPGVLARGVAPAPDAGLGERAQAAARRAASSTSRSPRAPRRRSS